MLHADEQSGSFPLNSAPLGPPNLSQDVRDKLVAERERLFKELQDVAYLDPYPSHSNFILCRLTDGRSGAELRDRLAAEHGVMIRHYSSPGLNDCVRISVGTPQQSRRLCEALQALA